MTIDPLKEFEADRNTLMETARATRRAIEKMLGAGRRQSANDDAPNPTGQQGRLYSDHKLSSSGNTVTISPCDGNDIRLYSENGWIPKPFLAAVTLDTTGYVTDKKYDLFFTYDEGSELWVLSATAWTDETTQAVTLDTVDGIQLLSTDYSYRYLGWGRYNGSTMLISGSNALGMTYYGTGNPEDPTGSDPFSGTIQNADGFFDYNAGSLAISLQYLLSKYGSNVAAANTTALTIINTAQTYNSESLVTGALLIGSNSAGKANMLWNPTAGTLSFRAGTTVGASIDTSGNLSIQSGLIAGTLTLSGASGAITIGTTPPTSATVGTGLWIDRTGVYSLLANVQQVTLTSAGLTAGSTAMNFSGIEIAMTTSILNGRAYKFMDGGTAVSGLYGYTGLTYSSMALKIDAVASKDSTINIFAHSPAGKTSTGVIGFKCDGTSDWSEIEMLSTDGGQSYIKLNSRAHNVDTSIKGNSDVNLLYADASADFIGIGMNNPARKLDVTGTFGVTGAATFDSTINKVTITAPATSATLTIADGKTLTASNTADVSGTNTGDETWARIKTLLLTGPAITNVRTSVTGTTYTQLETDAHLRGGAGATMTITLLDPTTHAGWHLDVSNTVAFTMVSASSNVTPKGGGAAGTAILPATVGAWAQLESNGATWLIVRSGT